MRKIGFSALRAAVVIIGSPSDVRKQYREGDLKFIWGSGIYPVGIDYKFRPPTPVKNITVTIGFESPSL